MKNHRFLSILFNFPQQILYWSPLLSRSSFLTSSSLVKIQTSFSKHRRYWESDGIPCSAHTCTHAKQQLMLRAPLRYAEVFVRRRFALSVSAFIFSRETLSVSKLEFDRADSLVLREKKAFLTSKVGKEKYNKCFWHKIHTCLKPCLFCFSFQLCCSIEENQCSLWKNSR